MKDAAVNERAADFAQIIANLSNAIGLIERDFSKCNLAISVERSRFVRLNECHEHRVRGRPVLRAGGRRQQGEEQDEAHDRVGS